MAVIVSLVIKSPKEEDNDVIEEDDWAMYMKHRSDEVLDTSSLPGQWQTQDFGRGGGGPLGSACTQGPKTFPLKSDPRVYWDGPCSLSQGPMQGPPYNPV